MSRKHYEKMAYQLAMKQPDGSGDTLRGWEMAVDAVATAMLNDSPKFNEARFYQACQFDYWKDRTPPSWK